MCLYYALKAEEDRVRNFLNATEGRGFASGTITPGKQATLVTSETPHSLTSFQFGMELKGLAPNGRGKYIGNARAETIQEKPMFASHWMRHRCVIPATSFREWQKHSDQPSQPFDVSPTGELQKDGLFAFAGIYKPFEEPNPSGAKGAFFIITTAPNETMSPIHNRMPAILAPSQITDWLERADLTLLKPAPNDWVTPLAAERKFKPKKESRGVKRLADF